MNKPKLLVILGPTSSGKSDLAVAVAEKLPDINLSVGRAEIISADSRQIYRGLDIGSGKVPLSPVPEGTSAKVSTEHPTSSERCLVTPSGYYGGVPHHLLDIVEIQESFTVVDFKEQAEKTIADIVSRNRLPVIAGGTGLYIRSIIDDTTFPSVPKNEKLRKSLSEKTPEELFLLLQKKDPGRAQTIEKENPRRLIRALEIVEHLGKVPEYTVTPPSDYTGSPYDVLQIGLAVPKEKLRENIHKRTVHRMENRFVEEVAGLMKNGVSLDRMGEFGLGYRCIAEALQNDTVNKNTLIECIENSEWHYAKRQMTWFKRDKRIEWFSPDNTEEIFKRIKDFMV